MTKEKILLVEKSDNNIATLIEQDNNTSTYNKEVIEVNTLNEDNNKTTTYDKEVSETSTAIPGTTNPANKEKNPYLQDNISITNNNNKRNSTLSKNKNLLSDPVLAHHDELAALYFNAEPQAENKNIDETLPETLPIMKVDNEKAPMLFCPSKSLLEQTKAQVLNS
ncbi:787_t:CDS:2 [Cetraspora pellucida]|uniref:787_t:CDS:1 n=1 Tax=Cetraspora pellucida TaxID=1433469 RepID=A0A9N9FZ21_9GLOM|nr:787_t:CDS:2 [Cetraspora pellucida]